jgi:hypothetical protein
MFNFYKGFGGEERKIPAKCKLKKVFKFMNTIRELN